MKNRISFSISVRRKNIKSNNQFEFNSIKDATIYLNTSSTTIRRYLNSNKLYKNIYLISKL